MSHLVRGVWIEILNIAIVSSRINLSHLVRGVWIEIFNDNFIISYSFVAPRERCVDWNTTNGTN